MSGRPPSSVSPVTSSVEARRPTRDLAGPFLLLVLTVLFIAPPGFASEPATVEPSNDIQTTEVDSSEVSTAANEATKQKLDASLRDIAAKLSAQTSIKADLIVRDETRRLTKRLANLNDETSTVADEISRQIDARLDSAMYKFPGDAYEVATNRKDGEL
ncbi:MAG: hypothetical protein JRJ58_05510 [Deltaproteobacteria bacterium]|nr:hypothetical protein [Deltaproteobacteria bacterium]